MGEWFNAALGRYLVALPDGRTTYRYRHVMEQHIGRQLRTDEHVHHINGDKADDRIENLQIVDPKEHRLMHETEIQAGRAAKRLFEWSPLHPSCVECGSDRRKHFGAGLCSRCYGRKRSREKFGHRPRAPRQRIAKVCAECGAEFVVLDGPVVAQTRVCCSRSCASRRTAKRRWAKQGERSA